MRLEAEGIVSCELRAMDGSAMPDCPPGAHIDVHLPNGLTRQYSVYAAGQHVYSIAVKRDPASRGGSAYVADTLRIGQTLRISAPRNNFPLSPEANHSVLIAGGIGITPLLAMARALRRQDRSYVLHYLVRSPHDAAFTEELEDWSDQAQIHICDTVEAGRDCMAAALSDNPPGTHFYCCGPGAMLDEFVARTARFNPQQVHLERFAPAATPMEGDAFTVELARSGQSVSVAPGISILDTLLKAGIDVSYSCQQGICGECEVKVLEGLPDHRDEVLTADEHAASKVMMVCCSRAKSAKLVLDL
jgi:ferredoxin-NADP reductase